MGNDTPRERPGRASSPEKFGPSQASVRVVPDQTEDPVLAVMRSILGRPRAALREAANLARAPDDAVVEVSVIPRDGRRAIQVWSATSTSLATDRDGRFGVEGINPELGVVLDIFPRTRPDRFDQPEPVRPEVLRRRKARPGETVDLGELRMAIPGD